VAVFFLQQIPVESLAEAEALEWEYLPAGAWPQAGRGPLPLLAVVEAEAPRRGLRAVEKLQPLLGGSLKQCQVPSRNTSAGVAGR
jgi:hypothetical protein